MVLQLSRLFLTPTPFQQKIWRASFPPLGKTRVLTTARIISPSGFTKSLAKEVGSRGITVNSVAPGFIETDMTSFLDNNSKDKIIESIPLNRLGNPSDVADLVAFLASDGARYITGQTISVDGGLFMY